MNKAPVSVTEDLTCIWVLAGVLSYRLCDRDYDCESCELFHALRGESGPCEGAVEKPDSGSAARAAAWDADLERTINSYVSWLTEGCRLHLDRYYCSSHLWVDPRGVDRAVIGMDGHILRVLYPASLIIPAHAGAWLERDEPFGRIRRGRMSVSLAAPLSGRIDSVNEPLIEALGRRDVPDGHDGWLMTLLPTEDPAEAPGLGRGERALLWYLRNIQLLKSHLRESLAAERVDLGTAVLNDGGRFTLDVEQVIGRARYQRLVEGLFELQI